MRRLTLTPSNHQTITPQDLEQRSWQVDEQQSRDWLLPIKKIDQPKFLTKEEALVAAIRKLNLLKNPFDLAWIGAIETTDRHDWDEPFAPTAVRQKLVPPADSHASGNGFVGMGVSSNLACWGKAENMSSIRV